MRRLGMGVCALALAACATAPQARRDSPVAKLFGQRERFGAAELFSSQPVHASQEAVFSIGWRRELTSPEFFEWDPREFMRPAVDDSGRVYAASRDGYVRAFDQDGVLLWEHELKGPFSGGMTVDADKLYVPTGDGALVALSVADGSQKWSYRANEELGSRPVVANGMVYVTSFADSIYALDAETGAWKWQYRRDVAAEFTIRGVAAPTVDFDKVFVGFSDGTAMALDASDGTVKWTRTLSTARQFPDVDAEPQVDGQGHVIFASYTGGIFALDEESGQNAWVNATPGVTELLLDEQHLYAGGAGMLRAIDLKDGQQAWKLPLPEGYAGAPTLLAKYLIVPTTRALVFVDKDSGEPRRVFDPGRGVSAAPAVSRNALYVVSNYGYLYALTLARPRG